MKKFKALFMGLAVVALFAMLLAPAADSAIDAVQALRQNLSNILTRDANTGAYTVKTGGITKGMLATAVTPSHVVKYAGFATWSGVGKTKKVRILGAVSTDIMVATAKTAQTSERLVSAYVLKNNTAIFTLYTGEVNNKSWQYAIHRATE